MLLNQHEKNVTIQVFLFGEIRNPLKYKGILTSLMNIYGFSEIITKQNSAHNLVLNALNIKQWN